MGVDIGVDFGGSEGFGDSLGGSEGFGGATGTCVDAGVAGGVSGCGFAPSLGNEYWCVSRLMKGRSFPSCDGSGRSPVAGRLLAAIEFAFDSKVWSFGFSADSFEGAVSR